MEICEWDIDYHFSNMCTRNFWGMTSEFRSENCPPRRGGGEAGWGRGWGELKCKLSFREHKDDKGPPESRPQWAAWHSVYTAGLGWSPAHPVQPTLQPHLRPQSPQSLVSKDPEISRNILTVLSRKRIF